MPTKTFRSRHYAAIGGLAALVAIASATTVFGVRAVDHAAMKCRHANETLVAHIRLANSAENFLSEIGRANEPGSKRDEAREKQVYEAVRGDILTARKAIALEFGQLRGSRDETLEFDRLSDIERALDGIASMHFSTAGAGLTREIRNQKAQLRKDLDDPTLPQLLDEAVADERREVDVAEIEMGRASMLAEAIAVGVGLATPIFAAAMLIYFQRVFLGSLKRLASGATALARGDFDHEIPAMPAREFDEVRLAFSRIGAEFKANRAALQAAHDRLESEVAHRTSALAAAKQRLEDSDRARRNFFADISHELRTPLTVIRGEAEIALRGDDKSAKHYQDCLTRIADQARHTNRLIDDLLFVARADSGAPRLDMRSVAICALMSEVIKNFRPIAAEKSIAIEWKCALNDTVVLGDRGRLRQALAVIVDNAVRYSFRGGEVRASCRLVEGRIEITVDDDGVGIMKSEFDRVFERYYRGGNAEDEQSEQEGMGLGLPVAKAIVEAHNGEIRLSPSQSGGVTATIALPIESELRAVS